MRAFTPLWIALSFLCSTSSFADALGSFADAGGKTLFGTITLQGPRGNSDGPALFDLLAGPIHLGGGNKTKVGSYHPTSTGPLLDFTCNVAVADSGLGSCTIRIFNSTETALDSRAQTIHFQTTDPVELKGIAALFAVPPTQDFTLASSDSRFELSRKGAVFSISYAWKK